MASATSVQPEHPHPVLVTAIEGRAKLFELAGEVDAYAAPRLESELLDAIDAGHTEVVIDMTRVTFIDIATLNAIVRALKRAYQRNGHLVLACGPGAVTRAIDLAGLRHTLHVYADCATALAALRRHGDVVS